uniref:(northern house mosquito) hypothetical protein n=1 Tax=Culex pipiens TaxID=7175 RepID=A0A8D8DFP8_CULPI
MRFFFTARKIFPLCTFSSLCSHYSGWRYRDFFFTCNFPQVSLIDHQKAHAHESLWDRDAQYLKPHTSYELNRSLATELIRCDSQTVFAGPLPNSQYSPPSPSLSHSHRVPTITAR